MDDDQQFRVAEQTFAQNFRPDCADLIYGLAQSRAGNKREFYVQSLDTVKEAARMGDSTSHGGVITLGCMTVLIGG